MLFLNKYMFICMSKCIFFCYISLSLFTILLLEEKVFSENLIFFLNINFSLCMIDFFCKKNINILFFLNIKKETKKKILFNKQPRSLPTNKYGPFAFFDPFLFSLFLRFNKYYVNREFVTYF